MKALLGLILCLFSSAALAQGCGATNPNCIVPTAPFGTNNNQAASTAFVQGAVGSGGAGLVIGTSPISGGTPGNILYNNGGVLGNTATTGSGNIVLGTSPTISGPSLTGVPTTPTAAPGTNTTQVASTAFVEAAVVAGGGISSVSNSDGTLSILTTSGMVTASLNLSHPNIWTGGQTFTNGITFNNSVSGTMSLGPQAEALGTTVITIPPVVPTAYGATPTGQPGLGNPDIIHPQLTINNVPAYNYTAYINYANGSCGLVDHNVALSVASGLTAGEVVGFFFSDAANPTGVTVSTTTTSDQAAMTPTNAAASINTALMAAANTNITFINEITNNYSPHNGLCADGIPYLQVMQSEGPAGFGWNPAWPGGLVETYTAVSSAHVTVTVSLGGTQYSNIGAGGFSVGWNTYVLGRQGVSGDLYRQTVIDGQDNGTLCSGGGCPQSAITETIAAITVSPGDFSSIASTTNGPNGCGWKTYGSAVSSPNLIFAPVSASCGLLLNAGTQTASLAGKLVLVYNHIGSYEPAGAPTLTSCGTGPSNALATDFTGTVTMGTAATGCTVTFAVSYNNVPNCQITWIGTPLASQYLSAVSTTAFTTVQTSTSGNKFTYTCTAGANG